MPTYLVERYLPGRTPEISNPILGLLLAAFLAFLQNHRITERPEQVAHERKLTVN